MPKLNEAERFLVERWREARLLEESMEAVRTKYKEVFEEIIRAVTESHRELNAHRLAVTQFWGQGYLGFGRKSWPGGDSKSPSGFWVENVRLEVLSAEGSDPSAYVWFSNKSGSELDADAARGILKSAAKSLLSAEEFKATDASMEERVLLNTTARVYG